MSTEDLHFLLIGTGVIALGALLIAVLVRRELAPATNRGDRSHRLFLAAALGLGVIAFAIKLAAFALMLWLPKQTIAPVMTERLFPAISLAHWRPAPEPPREAAPYRWQSLPAQAPAPADNPTTPAKVALGRRLFFDADLSLTRTVSCASCHDLAGGAGVDGRRTSLGIRNQIGTRNAPTVWNAGFQAVLFWDGRAASLEEQAKGPPLNPIEMGMTSAQAVVDRVQEKADYAPQFRAAFGPQVEISFNRIAQAIAAYERTLIAVDTPYDRFVRGDRQALDPAQLRGMALFQTLGCVTCHSGPNFSAASLPNLNGGGSDDNGAARFRVFPANDSPLLRRYDLLTDKGAAGTNAERGIWRVPSLRNVALTGPWLHNGAVTELEEVVRIMATAQLGATLGPGAHLGRKVFWSPDGHDVSTVDRPTLSDGDVRDVVAFLRALSSDRLAAAKAGEEAAE